MAISLKHCRENNWFCFKIIPNSRKKEEAGYVPLPKFYTFPSKEERERILYRNFVQVGMDVKEMIKDVVNRRGAK